MVNIVIKEEEINVYKRYTVEKFSTYFLVLGNEVVNINRSVVMKNSFSNRIYNINEILYLGHIELLDKVIGEIKSSIDEGKINIEIYSSVILNDELKEYIHSKNIKFINEKEIISGFDNYVKKYSNNESKYIYKIVRQEVLDYLFKKYNEKLINKCTSEKFRIREIMRCLFFEMIYSVKNQGHFSIDLNILCENNKISKLNLTLDNKDLNNIDLIRYMNSNKKISLQHLYDIREEFKVGMISPFSFGKSTILNALIGKDILKADLRAETAVITKVINDENKSFLVKRDTDDLKEINYEDKDDLCNKIAKVTSARAEGNKLKEVIINYDYPSLQGVTLIDSPGLFSRYNHHNDISINALDMSDMIIFVIDPSKIGERNFSQIIKENIDVIIKQKKHFCFVLSKLDLYEEDEERIIEELNIVLSKLELNFAPIFFVSGYFGLKSLMLRNGDIDINSIRKDRNIYVVEDEEILNGKLIEEQHWKNLWEFSRISELIDYILYVKEIKKC